MDLLDDVRSVQYGIKVSKAMLLLAQGYSTNQAAQEARVRVVTLEAWMREEDFMAVLTCLKEYGKLRSALDVLETLTDDAIAALRRTMQTGSPGQALEAARDVLKRAEQVVDQQEQAEKDARKEVARKKWRMRNW